MMPFEDIFSRVAKELGLSKELVHRTYRAYWKVVREHMSSLPLKEELTDEAFLELQPNVNVPSIGKFYVTLDRYHRVKKMYNTLKTK